MSAEEVKETTETENSKTETVEVELPELDRPLEKMTVKELREIGLLVPTMVGVHSMKKDELVAGLKEVYGIEDEVKEASRDVRRAKNVIKDLRQEKEQAREAGDKQRVEVLRRKINRMKKKTRKLAKAAI